LVSVIFYGWCKYFIPGHDLKRKAIGLLIVLKGKLAQYLLFSFFLGVGTD